MARASLRSPQAAVLERAEQLRLDLSQPGPADRVRRRAPLAAGVAGAPRARRGHAPRSRPGPSDGRRARRPSSGPTRSGRRSSAGTGRARSSPGSRVGRSRSSTRPRITGVAVVQRQGGRAHRPSAARAHRPLVATIGEWSLYPADHIGRPSGYAAGAPGSNTTLHPADDLGAGRDRGRQQRLSEREAADPRRRLRPTASGRSRCCPTGPSTSGPS